MDPTRGSYTGFKSTTFSVDELNSIFKITTNIWVKSKTFSINKVSIVQQNFFGTALLSLQWRQTFFRNKFL